MPVAAANASDEDAEGSLKLALQTLYKRLKSVATHCEILGWKPDVLFEKDAFRPRETLNRFKIEPQQNRSRSFCALVLDYSDI